MAARGKKVGNEKKEFKKPANKKKKKKVIKRFLRLSIFDH